jgi:hypothetical protein
MEPGIWSDGLTIKANDVSHYQVCPGSYLDWSETEDECGARFCPICERPADPYVDITRQMTIARHARTAKRMCACGLAIFEDDDYLCEHCRSTLAE